MHARSGLATIETPRTSLVVGIESATTKGGIVAKKPAYQTEPDQDFRSLLWQQGHITPLQFFRIGAWKSAKGLANLSMNSEDEFRTITERSMAAIKEVAHHDVVTDKVDWDEWQSAVAEAVGSKAKGTGLLGLVGVGYPIATALLCILSPKSFPVMDRWAVQSITSERFAKSSKWMRSAKYRVFTEGLASSQSNAFSSCSTIHERDLVLMERGMKGIPCPEKMRNILVD